jgi:ketosteroid isomerase-like protein
MSEADLELIRELHGRWEQGDFATAAFFDPRVEFVRIGGAGVAGEWRGIDQMSGAIAEWLQAWEDFRVEARRYIGAGDRVLVIQRQTARGRRSGLEYDHEIGHLFTIRAGKIVRWESYWETGEALEAAGLDGLPAEP